jgi:U3 small nucleolar RNA-associated protein 21
MKTMKEDEEVSSVAASSSIVSSSSTDEGRRLASTTSSPGNNNVDNDDYEAGSSRLFQPHRSIGLLTSAHYHHHNTRSIYTCNLGKFHLQSRSTSSDESFVTIPIGERFQIVTLSKLVPVLVSRPFPPSANHYRRRHRHHSEEGGEEEEVHRAISDSSLAVTIVSHGPCSIRRAVSISLFARTRPIATIDAFPFLTIKDGRKKKNKLSMKEMGGDSGAGRWGIVDVIELGKHRIVMTGEKDGKLENALLFAFVCAKSVTSYHHTNGKDETGVKEDDDDKVQVVGEDSSDDDDDKSTSSSDDGSKVDEDEEDKSSPSEDDDDSSSSSDSSESINSVNDMGRPPPADCYGRVLLVQATRTSLTIIKVINLTGIASNFIPQVGLHPATYVNKIVLGGRPVRRVGDNDDDDNNNKKMTTSMVLINVRSGKLIHSFKCMQQQQVVKNEANDANNYNNISITTLSQSPAVDTIAVGMSNGSVHLVNLLHDMELFSLRHSSSSSKSKAIQGKKTKTNDASMTAVSSISFRTDGNATRMGIAPLAVGCDDGSVSIWDLTPVEDEITGIVRRTLLTKMDRTHYGGVCKLEYLPGEPLLLSTGRVSNSIVLHVFDAPDHSGRILRQRRGHTSPPRLLRYLHPGISGGGILANAADGTDASSCQILSCGGPGDLSLRLFSTARSNLDKEFSQGPGLEKKARKFGKIGPEGRAELLLPEVLALATSETRSRDWGDLVTIHRDHAMAYVWSTKRGSQTGMPILKQPGWNISAMKDRPPKSASATSLAISACGNFCLVGTLAGVIYKYNLQSGLPRGSFPRDATSLTADEERQRKKGLKFAGDVGRTMRMLEKSSSKGGIMPSDIDQAERDRLNYLDAEAKRVAMVGRATHDDAVVGIAIDSLNKTVVTAGVDSKLVLWNFVTHMPHKKSPVLLPSPATKLTHVRDSDLAAIAMSDFGVAVFDCSSLTIVRYFGGSRCKSSSVTDIRMMSHTSTISDMQFGPDGRRLFTSSYDGTIRVWDVPTGQCVDWLTFSSPPTSLALSPTGEFLATSHVGRLGISLWCDKSFFRMVLLDGSPHRPSKMNEPCPVAECEQESASDHTIPSLLAKVRDVRDNDLCYENDTHDDQPPQAKDFGLITLSGLPPAHWKNLFHLELVKERNKPTEAPQKPPQAPFFLQWRSGLESGTMDTSTDGPTVSKESADGWDAVWSDDDAEDDKFEIEDAKINKIKRSDEATVPKKRRKVAHDRSKLADLLQRCFDEREVPSIGDTYSEITSYLAKMGPSSIDVEISSLCFGVHDLEEGLPLLHIASLWLLEACESHQSFEAVNAYLHRFLHVHGNVMTRMDIILQEENESEEDQDNVDDSQRMKMKDLIATIAQLKMKQQDASNRLQGKMQNTICLLRHLSRMV